MNRNINLLHGHTIRQPSKLMTLYPKISDALSHNHNIFDYQFCFIFVVVVGCLIGLLFVYDQWISLMHKQLIKEYRINITGVLSHKQDTYVTKSYKILQNSAKYQTHQRFWKIKTKGHRQQMCILENSVSSPLQFCFVLLSHKNFPMSVITKYLIISFNEISYSCNES